MKTDNKIEIKEEDEMLDEYDFDFSKSKPNKFAKNYHRSTVKIYDGEELISEKKPVLLDADLIKFYKTPARINKALRAMMQRA